MTSASLMQSDIVAAQTFPATPPTLLTFPLVSILPDTAQPVIVPDSRYPATAPTEIGLSAPFVPASPAEDAA